MTGQGWGWLPLAAAATLSLVWLVLAFSDPYVVQDDVRQHVVWFEALRDPTLFRGDFISGFFRSSNTPVYKALYELPAQLGLSPLLLAKLYPVALTLLTAWLTWRFLLTTGIGAPAAALGAMLFVQGIWVSDDLACATARAFSWPMLMAVLVCWRENRPLAGAALGALMALTYPSAAVFAGALIGLMSLAPLLDGKRSLAELRTLWAAPAIVVAGLFVGAVMALASGTGTGVISGEAARQMAEFQDGGRTEFFVHNPVIYWLLSKRSGALPEPVLRHVVLTLLVVAALLRWKHLPVEVRRLSLAALFAGLTLWAAAHLMLFSLYLPGRFPLIGERIAFALLAAALLSAWLPHKGKAVQRAFIAGLVLLPVVALAVPLRVNPMFNLPQSPRLIEALQALPAETLVAGFGPDLDNIPSNSLRRVLTAREYHLPYDPAYLRAMRERLADTAAAVFAADESGVGTLVERYGVTHILVDRSDVTPAGARQSWWWPILEQEGRQPACTEGACRVWVLEQPRCIVTAEGDQVLLSGQCLLAAGTQKAG